MNDQTKHALQKNLYQPANRVMKAICDKPYTSVAALTTFGLGIALLIPGNRRRLATPGGMVRTGSYLLGSAVLLTTLYLLGRNGRFRVSRKEL